MSDISILKAAGAPPHRQSRFTPLTTQTFFSGLWTQRSPFGTPDNRYSRRYLGGRPDILIDGLNVELTNYSTYIRRYGFQNYSSATVSGTIQSFFPHLHPDDPTTDHVIVDTTTNVYHMTTTAATSLFTKSNGATQTFFQQLGITLYMTDGVDILAWEDNNTSVRNWGIAMSPTGTSTGPNGPASGTDVSTPGGGAWSNPGNITLNDGSFASVTVAPVGVTQTVGPNGPTVATGNGWSNPNNILANDGSVASYNVPFQTSSGRILATGFGFAIPTNANILGIQVDYKRSAGQTNSLIGLVSILKAGFVANTVTDNNFWPAALAFVTIGNSSYLWGTTWTASDINNSGFGVGLQASNGNWNLNHNTVTGNLDYVRVTVTYNQPSLNAVSDYLEGTGFGFALGLSELITGVLVEIKGQSNPANPANTGLSVALMKNGAAVGSAKTGIQLNTSNTFISLGGSNDLWGTTWTANDFNQTAFGVAIQGVNQSGTANATWQIDYVRITVYGVGGPTGTPTGAGSLTTTNGGWAYAYAYGNSVSGHLSNSTPIGSSTGNFASKASVNVPVVASPDPQVNQIWVFRTKDGGSTLFALPSSPYPNVNATIVDTNVDSSLLTQDIAPAAPFNNPPPQGLGPLAYHMERMWGAVGTYVYYSAGPDIVMGNGNEAWPPANYFRFPTVVTKLVPVSAGLLVFTYDNLYLIVGTGISTFYPVVYQQGLGVLSYNAVDVQGSTIFAYTADRQFVSINAAGINELGFPIGDRLRANINPLTAYVASIIYGDQDKAVFVGDGVGTWYRCNWNQPPEGGPAWSPKAVITGGATALASVETSPGVQQLVIGQSGGVVAVRSYNTYTDNGTPFTGYLTLGSLVLAQPGELAEVQSITVELANIGSTPTLGVLLDEVSGTFETLANSVNDPPQLVPSSSVISQRFYLTQGAEPIVCRHMQLQISFAAEAVRNELWTVSIWGSLLLKE